MAADKLKPFFDSRVSLRSAHLNGRTYGYIFGPRSSGSVDRGTILLVHGFPDFSFGWRYQIPYLQSLGLDVIAPDCMGYGRTDAPEYTLRDYTFQRMAEDMAELLRQLGLSSVILGGHDWGGAIAWRLAIHTPNLYKAVMVICTPYNAPTTKYESLQKRVDTVLPNFGYQLQFASGEIEEAANSPQGIRQFLLNLYGARTPSGEFAFTAEKGVVLDKQQQLTTPSRVITEEELSFYVQEYSRHGLHGPLNWYRTSELNYIQELRTFFDNGTTPTRAISVEQESLFVLATKDAALPPWMSARMGERIPRLTRCEVDAGHWCLWEKPDAVNEFIGSWLRTKVFDHARI